MAGGPDGDSFEACHLAAVAAAGKGEWPAAEAWERRALALEPRHVEALTNLGAILRRLGRPEEALAAYDQALAVSPDAEATHAARANLLNDLQRWAEALASAERGGGHPVASNARGNALTGLGRLREAVAAYEAALTAAPGYFNAAYNLAKTRFDLGEAAAALEVYDKALALAPDAAVAHIGRGHALAALRRWAEAAAAYERAHELEPNLPFLAGARLHARMRTCDWRDFEVLTSDLAARIDRGEPAAMPFTLVATPLGPERQLGAARAYVRHGLPPAKVFPEVVRGLSRIRLGYFSADFHEHATAYLIAELIELHDRTGFEVVGFSYGPVTGDPMRRRLEAAFDRFHEVSGCDDGAIVALARREAIDIALDLKGYTAGFRPGLFAGRAAPVQASYLGFPMTMGAEFMDYLIADPVLVGDADRAFYAEKVARLPGCYQPNDRKRAVSDIATSRADHGLPADALVLASFNGSYKITPDVFGAWMRILAATPDAVLWLLRDDRTAAAELRRQAEACGLDAARLVFAPFRRLPAHLERLRHADLFLDTVWCSAHTTASDALWAGLPVLTRRGDTFAGRVAASLLRAADLPELITDTLPDYEAAALALVRDRGRLRRLRRRLAEAKTAGGLFDTPRYAAELEGLYLQMHARRMAGLPPEHLG